MDGKDKDRKDEWPDDDHVIYIPDEEYHSLMQSLRKLEEAQKEFHKIRENMKPLENGEWRVASGYFLLKFF